MKVGRLSCLTLKALFRADQLYEVAFALLRSFRSRFPRSVRAARMLAVAVPLPPIPFRSVVLVIARRKEVAHAHSVHHCTKAVTRHRAPLQCCHPHCRRTVHPAFTAVSRAHCQLVFTSPLHLTSPLVPTMAQISEENKTAVSFLNCHLL